MNYHIGRKRIRGKIHTKSGVFPVDCYEVTLEDYPDHKFMVHRIIHKIEDGKLLFDPKGWKFSEQETGERIAMVLDGTRKNAVLAGVRILELKKMDNEKLKEHIKERLQKRVSGESQ